MSLVSEVSNIVDKMMDDSAPEATKYLESQHREVESLFKQMEELGDRAFKAREKIFLEIARKLTHHAKIEELFLYPQGENVDKDLTLEAYEEHDLMKHMISKIKRTDSSDESYMAKVTVLKEVVEHHVKEEEKEYFPELRKTFSKDHLEELGATMKAKFDALEARN